jgi:hypothetical protein
LSYSLTSWAFAFVVFRFVAFDQYAQATGFEFMKLVNPISDAKT